MGLEIDAVHSRVNHELYFLAIRIVAEADAEECTEMGAPEPPLPAWQILGWAMEQAGSPNPSRAARWVCLQGVLPENALGVPLLVPTGDPSTDLGL